MARTRHRSSSASQHKSKKQRQEEKRKACHDALVLVYEPSAPAGLSNAGVDLLSALLCKDRERRLGMRGAHEVMAHAWFQDEASFSWQRLREGEATPPLVPSPDVINAGSIADAGGADDHDDPAVGKVRFGPEDLPRFASWEWRDELLMQNEILAAIESRRSASGSLLASAMSSLVEVLRLCGGCCSWWPRLLDRRPQAVRAAPADC